MIESKNCKNLLRLRAESRLKRKPEGARIREACGNVLDRKTSAGDGRRVVHWIDDDRSAFGARSKSARGGRFDERAPGQFEGADGKRAGGIRQSGFAGTGRDARGDEWRGYGVPFGGGSRRPRLCGFASGGAGIQLFSGRNYFLGSGTRESKEDCVRIIRMCLSKLHAVGREEGTVSDRRP